MDNKTVVAFGEIMLRLTPPDSILNATQFGASYGGSESNVLVALSCLGNATRYLTKLPDNDLGRGAVLHLQRYGVDCSQVISAGSNMGMYFFEPGFATRPAKVIYARKHAEITTLQASDINYEKALADCAVLHISGISFALSPSVEAVCFRLLQEAKKRRIPVSFDFNYRAKLWTVAEAAAVYRRIIPYADIVFCSRRDLTAFLDVTRENFFDSYGNVEYLVVRERDILSGDTHKIRAEVYTKTGSVAATEKEFAVLERIGGGDAFAAGFLHGWLHFAGDMARTLAFAADCIALKHGVRGDVLAARQEEIETSDCKDVRR
ncbi:MAG: sugar kinase [Oscillospiraceae bacterium]|nr:sugar kinase [Oscillospiraceae bacterium]